MARQDRRGPSDRSLVVGLVLMVALLFALVAIVLLPQPPLCVCVGTPRGTPTLPHAPTYPPAVITATTAAAAPTRTAITATWTAAAAATATAASQP